MGKIGENENRNGQINAVSRSKRGHFGNRVEADAPDDNATDILLIEGTPLGDTIPLVEQGHRYCPALRLT